MYKRQEFVYFRETSDRLSVDYILLCPKKVLYQLVNDLNPVSYTHLDVYKRQLLSFLQTRPYGLNQHVRGICFIAQCGKARLKKCVIPPDRRHFLLRLE